VEASVSHEDVVSAALGAGSALTGLALVFLGFAVSTLQSYAGDTPMRVLRLHRFGVWSLMVALTAGTSSVVSSMGWLISSGNDAWYPPIIWLFFTELGAALLGSVLVALAILRR
jgi:hypothetical protein